MSTLRSMVLGGVLTGLIGVLISAPALAQGTCPRPAGVPDNPLATPVPTASEVESGAGSIGDFARAARDYFNSIFTAEELGYAGCITRTEGPWKSGAIYLAAVTLDGRLFFNTDDMSTGGRPLNPEVYAAILSALGIPVDPANPGATEAALRQVAATRAFPNRNGGPVLGGYAVGYGIAIPYILVAGVDFDESLLSEETLPSGDPEIGAHEVVDRRTLKKFVGGAADYLLELAESDINAAFGIARSVLRKPPWLHGPVYLFMMDPNGFVHFHGGFPDRYEFQTPTETLRDEVTGDLILPQIIEVAQREGGGFVEYYFDNPDDDSDRADIPKVTFARQFEFTLEIPGFGSIRNSYIIGAGIYGDPVSSESVESVEGWLAHFGRAVASQAVEMIQGRMNSPAPGGGEVILGGNSLNLSGVSVRTPLTNDSVDFDFASFAQQHIHSPAFESPAGADRFAPAGDGFPGVYRQMTMGRFLADTSFHLSSAEGAEGEAGGYWSAWGRGAHTSFEGGGASSIEGDVTTAMLGVDYARGSLLAGVALSRADGDGSFENEGQSEMEADLTSVHPYLGYTVSERLSMWGILGYGSGEMTLDEQAIENSVETDIEMRMGAFGLRSELTKMGGFDMALKSDVLLTQVEADGNDGLESISAQSNRLRAMLEASRETALDGGGSVRPSMELGLRHDSGDVDEGVGIELGGSIRFSNPAMGLIVELRARGLLAHEEDDLTDWGVGGMISISPGQAGRGLALTVRPEVGEIAGGAARLWNLQDASRFANQESGGLAPRVRADVGYGMDAWGGLVTPFAGLTFSEEGYGTYRFGGRYRLGQSASLSLEGNMRERVADETFHAVMLSGSMRW